MDDDRKAKILTVISVGANGILCQHERGFKETFTRNDVIKLFKSGHMKINTPASV